MPDAPTGTVATAWSRVATLLSEKERPDAQA